MILFIISIVAGVLTVFAPCVLPLLPIIVGGSLSDGGVDKFNKKKAFTIIISLGVSIILFTLLLKAGTLFISIPEYVWQWISGVIVILIGLFMLFPNLWENQLIIFVSSKTSNFLNAGKVRGGVIGDVIIGSALGPVFSTCSPTYFIVLATVLPVNPAVGMIYLLTYTMSLCIALLIISLIGHKIMKKAKVVANPNGWFKKVLGVLFIVVGIMVIGGYDKKIQLFILDSGFFDVTKIEQELLKNNNSTDTKQNFKKAPELSSIDGYINTNGESINLASLKGKVVLLDIWTYSCINCQRTIPFINEWYSKYKEQGFEVIGLHTPEFSFEKIQSNVEKAVEKLGIKYPVVLDNDYSTWIALGNQYWPRKYLIDIDGNIIYDHIGEGNYQETEKEIQTALKDRATRLGSSETIPTNISTSTTSSNYELDKVNSPEIYFGSDRNQNLANGKIGSVGRQSFQAPTSVLANELYLIGDWDIQAEYAENINESEIIFNYEAKNVYITAGSVKNIEVEVYKDDVLIKKLTIKDEQLYTLIEDNDYSKHTLRLKILNSELKAFTFTFG